MPNDNGPELTAISKAQSDIMEKAKRLAIARRNNSPYTVERIPLMVQQCQDYADECLKEGKPLTHAGFCLATGIPTQTWYKMLHGEYDYINAEYMLMHDIPFPDDPDADYVEYVDENGEMRKITLVTYGEVTQKCSLLIQAQLESNCYSNRGNPAGSIFGLKARFQWQDTPQTVGSVTNNLVIADAEQAKKALEMLK